MLGLSDPKKIKLKAFVASYNHASGTNEAKTVCVFGAPRGGTTMVAGVARMCGLDMGGDLPINCEDPRFNLDLYRRSGHPDPVGAMRAVIAERNLSGANWGWKFPAAARYLNDLKPDLRNPHLVIVFRDPVAISSRQLKRGADTTRVIRTILGQHLTNIRLAAAWNVPTMFVSYEKAVMQPRHFVKQLTQFLGLPMPQRMDLVREFMRAGSYKEMSVSE